MASDPPQTPDRVDAPERLAGAIAASGLVESGSRVVALLSGGADSTGLVVGLTSLLGAERVFALHLDYRLRDDSGEDRRAAVEACDRLGVDMTVVEPDLDPSSGNTQELAREARYGAAEELRSSLGFDLIASGHTRSDLVETLLYRLAVSPGSRSLLGLPARRGNVVRPLLGLGRDEVRDLVERTGLPFRDDPTNAAPLYARNRIRNEVVPVLDQIGHGALEQTVAETRAQLEAQSNALEEIAADAIGPAIAPVANGVALDLSSLETLHPELGRIALRQAAERAAARPVPMPSERASRIFSLAGSPEGGTVELGAGLEARAEFGQVFFISSGDEERIPAASLRIPGSCRLGQWEVRADLVADAEPPAGPEVALCSLERLGDSVLEVRTWAEGDRIAPIGLDGSKSLADLFAEKRIPRTLRRHLPVVLDSTGRVVWVAGVAVSRDFIAGADDPSPALIRASLAGSTEPAGAGAGA